MIYESLIVWKLVVVDNCSTAGSADRIVKSNPDEVVLRYDVNNGFSEENDIGI